MKWLLFGQLCGNPKRKLWVAKNDKDFQVDKVHSLTHQGAGLVPLVSKIIWHKPEQNTKVHPSPLMG